VGRKLYFLRAALRHPMSMACPEVRDAALADFGMTDCWRTRPRPLAWRAQQARNLGASLLQPHVEIHLWHGLFAALNTGDTPCSSTNRSRHDCVSVDGKPTTRSKLHLQTPATVVHVLRDGVRQWWRPRITTDAAAARPILESERAASCAAFTWPRRALVGTRNARQRDVRIPREPDLRSLPKRARKRGLPDRLMRQRDAGGFGKGGDAPTLGAWMVV